MMIEATTQTGKQTSYPAYKNSGVEWLGNVPTHWEVKRLKFSASINDEALPETTDPDMHLSYVDIGSVHPIRGIDSMAEMAFEDAPSRARRIVRDGDTIISTVRTYLRAVAAIRDPVPNTIVSTGFAVVRPCAISPSFMSYVLSEQGFIEAIMARSVGVSYPAINASEIGMLSISFPPLSEQRSIADFLDRETEKIDTLVAKKRTLIERLKEERTALITHTVTRGLPPEAARAAGLEPHPKLKFSGVEWLGDVPEHWEVISLKWLATTASGDGISAEDIISECNQDYSIPVMGGNGLMGYTGKCNTTSQVLVIGRVGALCGNVHVVSTPVWVTDNALILTLNKNILNLRYLMSVLHARNLNEIADKTAQPLITGTKIRAESVPVPPTSEQSIITAFLDRETEKIDALVTKIETAIERLQEYRSALITAAVTGKIDVRKEAVL